MALFSFKNLSKSFDTRVLFKDISFDFPSSGIVMLLGKSGSGKTTLFNVLTGLEQKSSGSIFYKDKELISERDFMHFRKNVSFVFQEYGVINHLSGYDNLALGGYDFIDLDNQVIKEEYLFKEAGVLSGGEKQRLALLKAINKKSDIIFCDEPTGSLDESTSISVMEILKNVAKSKLIIMVTHDKELASSYGDVILELLENELKIIKTSPIENNKFNKQVKEKRNILKSLVIASKCFFKEKVKLLFAFLSLSLSLVSLFCVGGLKQNAYLALEEKISSYADYSRLKVSEVINKKIAGTSFSLSQQKCPSIYEIESLVDEYASVSYCYDSFFTNAQIKCNNEKIDASVIIFPFEGDIRVNNKLYELINTKHINIDISIEKDIITTYKNQTVLDKVDFHFNNIADKIYQEFAFLNSPCIFISHQSLTNAFKEIKLKNLSKLINSNFVSLYDRYTSFILDDDELSSYSLNIDLFKKEDFTKVIDILKNCTKKESEFEISSRAKNVSDTLSSTLLLLETLMLIFGVISLIISIVLLYLFINSTFVSRKKEFALYKSFGFGFFDFYLHNLLPILICVLFSYGFSIFLYDYLKDYLGYSFIDFFGFNIFLKSNFVFDNLLIISLTILFLCLLLSLYPSFKANKLKVSEVFKSE